MEEMGMTLATTASTGIVGGSSEGARAVDRLPPVLSVIAGMVEMIGFLLLGGLFTGHITGNLVVIAALLVRGGSPTAPQILAVPTFIAALVVVWLVARAFKIRGPSLLRPMLLIQFLLLAGVLVIAVTSDVGGDPNSGLTSIGAILATSAMACQFGMLRLGVPGAPSTAVMTGNLTNSVLSFLDIVSPGRPLMPPNSGRFGKATVLVVGFFCGCVAGALGVLLLKDWSWTFPVALAAAAVAMAPTTTSRPTQVTNGVATGPAFEGHDTPWKASIFGPRSGPRGRTSFNRASTGNSAPTSTAPEAPRTSFRSNERS
jgi:uncharacterized membrane protein YoaK (UPF0700 family)